MEYSRFDEVFELFTIILHGSNDVDRSRRQLSLNTTLNLVKDTSCIVSCPFWISRNTLNIYIYTVGETTLERKRIFIINVSIISIM